jgi:LacI family transcriptional regulator
VDRELPDVDVDTVLTDNQRGGCLATRHLVELGHRRIACIIGPSDLTLSAQRIRGYRQALADAGLAVDEQLIVRGDFGFESGHEATWRLLEVPRPPSAIFACNDVMAIGATCAAVRLGCQVPRDLSVVGYDDIPLASYTNPPLTTVAQPNYDMGVQAATMLLDQLQDATRSPRRVMLEVALKVRCSTSPPGSERIP